MGEITYSSLRNQTKKDGDGFKETAMTEKHTARAGTED